MTQFAFLQREWPMVFAAASKAEGAVRADPRTACFYARRTLELAVGWAYKHDPALRLPYQDNLSALVHEPTFKQTAGEAVFNKARVIVTLGNRAVHSHRPVPAVRHRTHRNRQASRRGRPRFPGQLPRHSNESAMARSRITFMTQPMPGCTVP